MRVWEVRPDWIDLVQPGVTGDMLKQGREWEREKERERYKLRTTYQRHTPHSNPPPLPLPSPTHLHHPWVLCKTLNLMRYISLHLSPSPELARDQAVLDPHLRELFTIPPTMSSRQGELHPYPRATSLIPMLLDFRLSMETSVAPPPVILDTPSGTGEGGEEGEGEDEDYVVGNSTSLAPPTNEKSTILPTSETTPNQPEGERTNVSCLFK